MPIIQEDPLRRYNADSYNFKSVKGETAEAVHYDWKRDKVDDAKKKAIYDSRSYDEFKDRVAGCTLKPIHRSEFNAPPKFTLGKDYGNSVGQKPVVAPLQDATVTAPSKIASERSGGSDGTAEKVPRNGHEFERELRRKATAEEKVRLLELVLDKSGSVARLFGRELDGEMLRQVLISLEEVQISGNASKGIARRFFVALAVDCPVSITAACSFFDAEERATLARLLARDPASDHGEDVRVCAAFGIPVSSVAEAAATLPASPAAADPPLAPEPQDTSAGAAEAVVESRGQAGYGGMD